MNVTRHLAGLACVVALLGCEQGTQPTELETSSLPQTIAFAPGGNGIVAAVTGGGEFLIGGVDPFKFTISAKLEPDGSASGNARHHGFSAPFDYDFKTTVLCMAVDDVLHRAWIAGVIDENNSTDPAFQQAIHQPGRDIWFRVADGGEGNGANDRITFVGFQGSAGVQTSAEYCARRLWLNEAQQVRKGNIQIH